MILMRRSVLCVLAVLPLGAAELVTLKSGFRLEADRCERVGSMVRLHARQGSIEVPAEQVESIEKLPDPVAHAAPAPVPAPAAAIPSNPPAPATPRELVEQAARKAGLPPELVRSLASAESAFNQKAISSKGAIGIMQLMPATAASLAVDPHVAEQNVEGGVRYLSDLLQRYEGDVHKALAAYNAGPGAVEKYKGIPPYRETVQYVDRVVRRYLKERPDQAADPARGGSARGGSK